MAWRPASHSVLALPLQLLLLLLAHLAQCTTTAMVGRVGEPSVDESAGINHTCREDAEHDDVLQGDAHAFVLSLFWFTNSFQLRYFALCSKGMESFLRH